MKDEAKINNVDEPPVATPTKPKLKARKDMKCPKCDKSYTSERSLERHLKSVHKEA